MDVGTTDRCDQTYVRTHYINVHVVRTYRPNDTDVIWSVDIYDGGHG